MKHLIFLCLISGIGHSAKGQQKQMHTEADKLKQVLFDYFDGIKNRNTELMKNVTTDDFMAFEEGKVYNNDSVFRDMKKLPYKTASFKFDNFRIKVDKTTGSMSYFENAVFVLNDTTKYDLHFIGSASFIKTDKGWKMSFMHATRKYVPRNKPVN